MTVSNYSVIPAENNSPAPNGAPEGMSPGSLNDTLRVLMAAMRLLSNGMPWFEYRDGTHNGTFSYVAGTQFKIVGNDATSHYHVNRRVKIVGTSTYYGSITASSYGAGATTVTVALDSGTLANEAITVYTSVLSADLSAIPENIIQDIAGDMVSGNTETGGTLSYSTGKINLTVSNQDWSQIGSKPSYTTRWPAWSEVSSKPSTFTPTSHSHAWADITGEPVYTTRWPTWAEVTGKPSTFAPISHSHAWADITGEPVYTTRWPTWAEVTSKPSTFAPTSHTHPWSQLTSIPSNANGNRTVSTGSPSGGSDGDIWYKV